MADNSRIDDLRRRVQKDPASIAFAQLAEECRRAGVYQEAVDICRQGLKIHPGYLSARVTLGRSLVELNQLDDAQAELSRVLESAPENLAAIRGLAEIYHRRGDLAQALAQYRAALLLARNDPDLEQTIADLSREIEPAKPVETGGLTLQSMQAELLKHAPPPRKSPSASTAASAAQAAKAPKIQSPQSAQSTQSEVLSSPPQKPSAEMVATPETVNNPAKAGSHEIVQNPAEAGSHEAAAFDEAEWAYNPPSHEPADNPADRLDPDSALRASSRSRRSASREGGQGFGAQEPGSHETVSNPAKAGSHETADNPVGSADSEGFAVNVGADDRAARTVAALEQWLDAIHVARAHRRS